MSHVTQVMLAIINYEAFQQARFDPGVPSADFKPAGFEPSGQK